MARTKKAVKNRARAHRKLVKAGRKRRIRTKSRGFHPASARRRKRSEKRRNKLKLAARQ